ncbi:MAG: hypothetical protein QM664_13845 [Flavihumibacter sp.]
MHTNQQDNRRKRYSLRRSILDYGMGGIILLCGVFFLASEKLNYHFDLEPVFRNTFAFLCIIYGAWRMYRGYKKDYYNE